MNRCLDRGCWTVSRWPDFVSGLESEFGVSVPDSDLSARKFDTIDKVEAYLDAKGA